jgi:hypothetical protein
LAAGEIGFETDTNKFKIGNGTSNWGALNYFANSAAITELLDGAPGALDTLNELAAAIADDPTFFSTVATNLSNHEADTTNVHGIANTANLATTSDISTHNSDTTNVHGIADTSDIVLSAELDSHTGATTSVHGIADTAALATKTYADGKATDAADAASSALSTHASDTTGIHGIADTSALETQTGAQAKADNAKTAAEGTAASALSDHNSDTTNVHGIVDTAHLVTTSGAVFTGNIQVPAPTLSTHATNKQYVDEVAAGINFHPAVVTATIGNITLSGAQTVDGVAVVAGDRVLVKNQTNQTENGIYVVASGSWTRALDADNNPSGELSTGDFVFVLGGANNEGFGYVLSTPSPITIGTSNILYVPFSASHTIEAGNGLLELVPGELSVDTSVIASVDDPIFTGTVTMPDNSITTAMINSSAVTTAKIADLNVTEGKIQDSAVATAKIANSAVSSAKLATDSVSEEKIVGLAVTTAKIAAAAVTEAKIADGSVTENKIADSAVTSGKIANGTIVNADISATAAIAQSKIDGLTTSLGLLAPKADPTFTGTVTVAASGVAFTDGSQTKQGVPSLTPIIQKTASYTLSSLTERDSLIEVASSSATTITIPADSAVNYPVGTALDILQTSTGQVTIAAGAGVTVNATPGLKLRTQWSSATLFKRSTNLWVVYGDLSA